MANEPEVVTLGNPEESFEAHEAAMIAAHTPPVVDDKEPAKVADKIEPDSDQEPEPRNSRGQFSKRSKRQNASAEDVPRIKELTAKWRQAEAERDQYKREAEEARRTRATTEPAKTEPARPDLPSGPTFTEPEPSQTDEKFLKTDDPYGNWLRAATAWDRRREAFEQAQTTKAQTTEQQIAAEQKRLYDTYQGKLTKFVETHPDLPEKIDALKAAPVSPLLQAAIMTDDNGPEILYSLVRQPALLDELHLLTVGKPVDEATVASTQRLLAARVRAASTGSAPSRPSPRVPPPPNPVRTGPMTPPDEPPGDDASFEAHEAYYARQEARRRASR